MSTRSSAWISLLLSALVPGLGQIYNREVTKGLVIFACGLTLALLAYWISGINRIAPVLALLLLWVSAAVDAYKIAKTAEQGAEFYYRKSFVVAMLLLVGPLALPLLWQSPNFSRTARWLWSVLVAGVALLFAATPYLLKAITVSCLLETFPAIISPPRAYAIHPENSIQPTPKLRRMAIYFVVDDNFYRDVCGGRSGTTLVTAGEFSSIFRASTPTRRAMPGMLL